MWLQNKNEYGVNDHRVNLSFSYKVPNVRLQATNVNLRSPVWIYQCVSEVNQNMITQHNVDVYILSDDI